MTDFYSQINVLQAPSTANNVVRLTDLKDAVDSKFKMPVRLASSTNLAGTYSSSAKTLTASANGALSIDGKATAVGNRVLLFGQTTATQNGVYVVTTVGTGSTAWVLTRAADFNTSDLIYAGVKIHVTEGTANADVTYVLATDDPITLDTTALNFTADTGLFPPLKEYKVTLASGTANPVTVTHNLGTYNVTVEVIRVSDYATVMVGVTRSSTNAIVLDFGANLTTSFIVLVRAVS
jgi:hypothetical protein